MIKLIVIVIYWMTIISFIFHFTRDLVFMPEQSEGIIKVLRELKIKDMKVIQYVILHDCRFLCPEKRKKREYKKPKSMPPKIILYL